MVNSITIAIAIPVPIPVPIPFLEFVTKQEARNAMEGGLPIAIAIIITIPVPIPIPIDADSNTVCGVRDRAGVAQRHGG